jgi:hypothetical protein
MSQAARYPSDTSYRAILNKYVKKVIVLSLDIAEKHSSPNFGGTILETLTPSLLFGISLFNHSLKNIR